VASTSYPLWASACWISRIRSESGVLCPAGRRAATVCDFFFVLPLLAALCLDGAAFDWDCPEEDLTEEPVEDFADVFADDFAGDFEEDFVADFDDCLAVGWLFPVWSAGGVPFAGRKRETRNAGSTTNGRISARGSFTTEA
jgi:hypothetical protein